MFPDDVRAECTAVCGVVGTGRGGGSRFLRAGSFGCECAAPHSHTHAAFAVGTLHGVAGSSHIVGVLPALAFPAKSQAIGYLLAYGIGTILAMSSFSTVISAVAKRATFSTATAARTLMFACSSFAVVLGGYW